MRRSCRARTASTTSSWVPTGAADPVAPTLVITAVGLVEDPTVVPLTGAVTAGNDVWLVGPVAGALGGSHYEMIHANLGAGTGERFPPPEPGAPVIHRAVASLISEGIVVSGHDLSEGGLAVAAAEWAFGGRRGLELVADVLSADPHVLFGEGSARYLLEVAPEHAPRLEEVDGAQRLGRVTDGDAVVIGPISVTHEAIGSAFRGHIE